MTQSDCTCTLHCPPVFREIGTCCFACFQSRKEFCDKAPRSVQQYWDETSGFYDPNRGCRLNRRDRPPECNAYLCTDMMFVSMVAWDPKTQQWKQALEEIYKDQIAPEQMVHMLQKCYAKMLAHNVLPRPEEP